MESDKKSLLHAIRNFLVPIQTFLQVVDTSREDSKLREVHERCKENLTQIQDLLKKLDGVE